jgi:hypothetical protein
MRDAVAGFGTETGRIVEADYAVRRIDRGFPRTRPRRVAHDGEGPVGGQAGASGGEGVDVWEHVRQGVWKPRR